MAFRRGYFKVLPATWTFLRMKRKELIDNQYVRNRIYKIPTLEFLSALHVAHLVTPRNRNAGKVNLRQMRCVMATLEQYSKKEN